MIQDILMLLLASVGLFFMLVAAIGVLRMPDLFMRMHAATKASTLGISGIALAALAHYADFSVTTRVLLIILFFFLTAPVGAHALGRAAYVCGIQLAPHTSRFDLQRARILCPTRGGPPSAALQAKAIQLARESAGDLTFLYVINRELVENADSPREALRILAELRTLGQSILAAAQAQARAQNVQAQGLVRVGELESEILRLAQEQDITLVVLGYPEAPTAEEQHLAEERVWKLADAIQTQSHARVVVAREELATLQ